MTDTVAEAPAEIGQAQDTGQPPAGASNPAVQDLTTDSQSSWYGEISDPELSEWAKNKNFADPETALKSYRGLEKMVGQDRLSVPDPEKLSEWDGWDKLGAPKEADGYKDAIKMPEMPEGMAIDEQFLQAAFAKGAEARIPSTQMQSMIDLYAEQQTQAYQQAQETQKKDAAQLDALYEQWGEQKNAKLEAGRLAAQKLGFDGELLSEIGDGWGSAKLVQAFAKLGEQMREGGLISGQTKDGAKSELQRLNDRIAAGETLSPADMQRRSALYSEAYD